MISDRTRHRFRTVSRAASLALASFGLVVTTVSCGGNSSPTEPTMTGGTGASTATIALTSSGVSVHLVTVTPGAAVTFMNDDTVPHEMASDPHPVHTQCPELNGPVLQPGMSFTATMANKPETCGFHDHLDPTNAALQGTITVSK